jgi:hypothetical protein
MTRYRVLLLLASTSMSIAQSTHSEAPSTLPVYAHVTLCRLGFNREKVNPKYISLDAEYVNADPHGVILLNRRCPRRGLDIGFSETGLDAGATMMKDQFWIISHATGTFRGILSRDVVTGRLSLTVQSVLDFRPHLMYPGHNVGPIRLPEPELPTWPKTR